MQHGAHTAHKVGVDERAGALPLEILVVGRVVEAQVFKVLSQGLWGQEVLHVDVGVRRCYLVVVRPGCTQYDWNDVISKKKGLNHWYGRILL